ncbi:hypothetical protein Anas_06190 [Armadillidium nasatum]|uniref:Allatostatin n=1 Tax=Armadillidium nasatum TaxID=96803 RepID=A0A5N5SKI5_9CRUS|nr:hypothetical protein Anas_06190 [Armadillidium nasatum]
MIIKSWCVSFPLLVLLVCGLTCSNSFVLEDEARRNDGLKVLSPVLYKILLERYPQLFDPNYEMEKRYNAYEFGLGKRSRQYSFGIGKRSGKFNFGLGKKSEAFGFRTEDDNNPLELIDSDDFEETGTETLRGGRNLYLEDDEIYDDYLPLNRNSRMYSFGIGKRLNGNPSENPLFQFGLGKRPISSFNFGLGKRRDLISFENDNNAEETEDKERKGLLTLLD